MKKKGFTLIELLVVIAVISGLAGVLIFLINPAEINRKSRDSKRFAAMQVIKSAIDLTLADGKTLPATPAEGIVLSSTDIDGTGTFDVSKYTPIMPVDPSTLASGLEIVGGSCVVGTANTPQYRFWSNGSVYVIWSRMESQSNCSAVTTDGNNNATFELGTDPGLDRI
jgi:prepilin-type N-terminal cleavage/methylation domain-containing protein